MKLYQKFGSEQEGLFGPPKSQTLGNLSVTKALMLIDIPDEELGGIIEDHDLESMTTREVAALKKDLADAKAQAAQAQAEQSAAEQAREKIAADMALANERIAGLSAEVEARTAAARLEKELEELRSRPVDVAVEADPAAIEAARKEAEAAMQTQLDKVKKARDDANEARKAAEKDLETARQMLAKMRNEKFALLEEMGRAGKKVPLAANEDFVLFRTLLDQTRELANKMVGVLLKTRNKDPEGAKGMEADLLALSGEIRDAAQGGPCPRT